MTATSRTLNQVLCVIGVLLVVSTVARGGGPLALGVIVGVLFIALGAARLRLIALRARVEPAE